MTIRAGQLYFDQDQEALQKEDFPDWVRRAWTAHWAGSLKEAARQYAENKSEGLSDTLRELIFADALLVNVKLGNYPVGRKPSRIKDASAAFIYWYAIYTWKFWFNQGGSWKALWHMLFATARLNEARAWRCLVFLSAHLATIQGRKSAFPVARWAYKRAQRAVNEDPRRSYFFDSAALSAFSYTCLAAGRKVDHDDVLALGERNLGPDPYYLTVFDACALYHCAYAGDTVRTQVYANKLRRHSDNGVVRRYSAIADIMETLPFALQGYVDLVDERIQKAAAWVESCPEPLVRSQVLRVSSLIALHRGELGEALGLAKRSSEAVSHVSKTIFWLGIDRAIVQCVEDGGLRRPFAAPFLADAAAVVHGPSLSETVLELVAIARVTSTQDDKKFMGDVAQVLARHLGGVSARVYDALPAKPEALPTVCVLSGAIVIEGADPDRSMAIRGQLAAISPFLEALVQVRGAHEASRRVERLMAADEIARRVAHDIRSPVAALRAIAQMNKGMESDVQELFNEAVSRVEQIAEDVLRRGREGKGNRRAAVVCAEKLAREIVAQKVLEFCMRPDVAIELDGTVTDEPGLIRVQPALLQRALSNLVNNAVEALPRGGKVTVRPWVDLHQVGICVVDNGVGIPPSILDRLRREAFSHGKVDGNGIGLHSARQLAEEGGGTLSIESQEGVGTKVEFILPRVVQGTARASAAKDAS